jgi:hypothetical protein
MKWQNTWIVDLMRMSQGIVTLAFQKAIPGFGSISRENETSLRCVKKSQCSSASDL